MLVRRKHPRTKAYLRRHLLLLRDSSASMHAISNLTSLGGSPRSIGTVSCDKATHRYSSAVGATTAIAKRSHRCRSISWLRRVHSRFGSMCSGPDRHACIRTQHVDECGWHARNLAGCRRFLWFGRQNIPNAVTYGRRWPLCRINPSDSLE